ncbi:LacI family DNA-binding transcriptional regulator [Cytophagaceae bacterium DM2B3-1]|uniref:LacI family DNA-binding transcriptional regulator n=1 Tax=Xanthocytophaga flava TaxID=3048013 RepID=A0ABT7CKJ0_9BACT|nr:LacI family DNA-binding transcriptional regulator [Xanthocytophaga flavus]MDJ1468308.1 LacI family DNA-binding transcriptional regulator [Xanthocytophaga flavus]MDJ1493194.1 LacI family DNA-binding transcriptional regulator [Xanthocytophaga flavus]
MKKHQITILDIARQLNISKSTVSRALTGHPKVSPETRKAVLELAVQMDYQPNMLSVSLVKNKSNTIGVIVPEFMSSFFPQVILGIQQVARTSGYTVLITQCSESYEQEVANARLLLASQVDGLLVSLTKETLNYDHLKIFQRKGIPVVFFNRVCEDMEVPKVIVDDYEGAYRATEHLITTGRKRIAHLAGPATLAISRKRLDGYRDALRRYGIPSDESLIISYDLTMEKVDIYVNHLLNLANRPDALFCINDPTAIQAIQVIKQRGLRIPDDIAVVGFSNDYYSAYIEPSLTTVAQPVQDVGSTAARLLINQIETDCDKPIIKQLKTELIIRRSTV